jgi:hypothetical protein
MRLFMLERGHPEVSCCARNKKQPTAGESTAMPICLSRRSLMLTGLTMAWTGAGDSRAALARGDLATRPQRLEPLVMGTGEDDFALSQREYKLETGRYYRWRIAAAGQREYNLVAPEFWRNVWIRQVVVGKTEIKTSVLEELDFDDVGEVEVFFVPVRTGTFTFRVRGLEERGMTGNLIVE